MLTRPIPSTNEPLPVVGLGTWQTFDVGPDRQALDQRKDVLRILFEAGGRVIDSSPMYGRAEEVVGTLLSEMGAHGKAFLATKVWTSGEAAGVKQMQASAAKMRAPVIDLMQIHNLVDWRTQLGTMRAWRDEGRLRYLGITHYTASAHDALAAVLRNEALDFVQVNYSLDDRAAEERVLPMAAARGVAVIVNLPFGGGALMRSVRNDPLPTWAAEAGCASFAQLLLKFVLAHPAVTCVIPGTGDAAHMADDVAAGTGPMPDAALRARIAAFWDAR